MKKVKIQKGVDMIKRANQLLQPKEAPRPKSAFKL